MNSFDQLSREVATEWRERLAELARRPAVSGGAGIGLGFDRVELCIHGGLVARK
jgi:hypothetical protein